MEVLHNNHEGKKEEKREGEKIGRFLTVKYNQILKFIDKKVPSYAKKIIEPFSGKGHLLKTLERGDKISVEKYYLIPFENTFDKAFLIVQNTGVRLERIMRHFPDPERTNLLIKFMYGYGQILNQKNR